MGAIIRYPIAVVFAAVITFGLFFLMQALIAMNSEQMEKGSSTKIADIHMPERKMELIQEEKKPDKPEEPEQPPPDMAPPPMEMAMSDNAVSMKVNVAAKVEIGGINLNTADGEYLPIVKVAPVYPSRALSRGIEGYVIVEFVVTAAGTVRDPVVIEAFTDAGKPTTMFNKAATKASLKFKYKPKVVDGEPVEVAGVQNKITFKIAD